MQIVIENINFTIKYYFRMLVQIILPNYYLFVALGVGFLLLASSIYLFIRWNKSNKKLKATELKFRKLEDKIDNAELQIVESKLNPHLFKNILNSIQSHAYQTYYALDKMANVLDFILYESRNKFVTPKEEIEFALNLIEINKIKLSPLFALKIKSKIDDLEPLYNQKILAPLITIDLIENAFKHADLQSSDAFISISFEFRNGTFYLTVSNKISGLQPLKKSRGGIGIEMLEQRLKIIYKNHYKLERYAENEVYTVQLKIDLFEYKAEMHIA